MYNYNYNYPTIMYIIGRECRAMVNIVPSNFLLSLCTFQGTRCSYLTGSGCAHHVSHKVVNCPTYVHTDI